MLRCSKADFEEVDFFVWKPYLLQSNLLICLYDRYILVSVCMHYTVDHRHNQQYKASGL